MKRLTLPLLCLLMLVAAQLSGQTLWQDAAALYHIRSHYTGFCESLHLPAGERLVAEDGTPNDAFLPHAIGIYNRENGIDAKTKIDTLAPSKSSNLDDATLPGMDPQPPQGGSRAGLRPDTTQSGISQQVRNAEIQRICQEMRVIENIVLDPAGKPSADGTMALQKDGTYPQVPDEFRYIGATAGYMTNTRGVGGFNGVGIGGGLLGMSEAPNHRRNRGVDDRKGKRRAASRLSTALVESVGKRTHPTSTVPEDLATAQNDGHQHRHQSGRHLEGCVHGGF